jgi:hypothetical protein
MLFPCDVIAKATIRTKDIADAAELSSVNIRTVLDATSPRREKVSTNIQGHDSREDREVASEIEKPCGTDQPPR